MKKAVACLLTLLLMLTMIYPTFALNQGETLKLAVLGDSISAGTGLNDSEASRYSTLVVEYFHGEKPVSIAYDGNECWNVLGKLQGNGYSTYYQNAIKKFTPNCFALSVGSNDYLEYLADYIAEVSKPGEDYTLDDYNNLTDFFEDVLLNEKSRMRAGILRFLYADQASRTDWKNDFCNQMKVGLTEIIEELRENYSKDAPILLLNYYNPAEPYMDFADKASTLLNAANRNINGAVELMDRARTAGLSQKMALLSMIRTKLVKLSADIYLFVPLLKEFDLDLTLLSPLLALVGVGFVGVEAFSPDRVLLEKLGEVNDLVSAVNQLLCFTDEVMDQLNNKVMSQLAKENSGVVVIDAADLGKNAENISTQDHFHPSEQGQQIIADKMIAALETIYAGETVTPPAPEQTDWMMTGPIIILRWWLAQIMADMK